MNNYSTPPMAMEIIEREMKEKTGKLVLSDCGLRTIPREVFEMDWLEELVLTNARKKVEKTLKVKKKTKNRQEPNFLNEISSEIARLGNLKKLAIGGYYDQGNWPISDISALGKLDQLEQLTLCHNGISDASILQNFESLQDLDIRENNISDISFLSHLKSLKNLDISGNNISDISPLQNLLLLENIGCANNEVVDLSPVEKLTNLFILSLRRNQISDISPLHHLKKLDYLEIDDNNISDISALSDLSELKTLTLSNNNITNVEALSELMKLDTLFLDNNKLISVRPLILLSDQMDIALDGNDSITDCPPEVWQTNDLQQIRAYFQGNFRDFTSNVQQQEKVRPKSKPNTKPALGNIPTQSIENARDILGADQSFEELFEAKDTTQEIDDIKLIFVGNSGAGKTQLSKYFETGKLDKTRETTHGIRLNRWLPSGKVSPAFDSIKNKIAANIWDFGGQEYYHGTFRLFLSNYAVYILVWESDTNRNDILSTEIREDESEDLQHYNYKYWLDNIRHFAPKSPILIVQNKIDKDQRERIHTTLIDDYNILGDHHISLHRAAEEKNSHYKWSFDIFCEDLSKCFEKVLLEKAQQPKSVAWRKIKDAVVKVASSKRKNSKNPFSKYLGIGKSIKIKDFEKACLEIESELTESELYTMPRWLHNSGLVIYFGEDEVLNDRVYLDPIWVTTGIYKILNETVRAKDGVFAKVDINAKKGLNAKTVLALMKEMEIVFEKTDQPDIFVAPQYLPETHPVEDLYAIAANGLQQKAYYVRLPLYFFRKVLQRMIFFYGMSQNVDAKYYWKQGILFEKKGTKVMFKGIMPAQVSETTADQSMDHEHGIFLIGAQPSAVARDIQKEVFHIIAEILEEKDLAKINRPTERRRTKMNSNIETPFADIHHRPNNWTSRYESEEAPRWLKKLEVSTNGEDFVNFLQLCNENRKKSVFIPSIPNRLSDGSLGASHRLRIHDFELLLDDQPQRPLKVFFSYSHKDTEIMNQLAVHLAPLKRLEKIETWSDKAIQAGDEWDEAIINNLKSSDIVLFLVSADFIASSYIWEKEIPLAMELRNDVNERVKRVIPIYLRPFDFSGLNFSDLEMVPKNDSGHLTAISQWENMDEAFMEVAKSIRKVIEETK